MYAVKVHTKNEPIGVYAELQEALRVHAVNEGSWVEETNE